jgi:hypothetical protein
MGVRGTGWGKERVFMGCGWLTKGVVTVLAVAALLAAPAALAATPEQIYRDFEADRKLDGAYTVAELQAVLQSPIVQGYGKREVVTELRPTIERQVAAEQPLQQAVEREGLPFTGLDLALLTAGGLFLLAFGFSLRRLAKAKQTK